MAAASSLMRYTSALVRPVPASFASALRMGGEQVRIDVGLASKQHEQYIEVLRSAVPKVVRLPARDDMPDSCFVEDPINAVPGSATLLPMGHARREAEAAAMQHDAAATGSPVPAPAGGSLAASGELAVALETGVARLTELCATGALRSADAAPAVRAQRPRVDGGDVLFTGHELVVGLSARSNLAGACALAAAHAFAVPVIAVDLERVAAEAGEEFSMLHLKSVATMLGPELLLAQDDAVGRGVASAIRSARSGLDRAVKRPAPDTSGPQRDRPRAGDPRSGDRPSVWVVPGGSAGSPSDRGLASARGLGEVLVPASEAAANVVFANGLVMRPPASTAPRSAAIIDEAAGRAGLRVEEVDMSELAKADGPRALGMAFRPSAVQDLMVQHLQSSGGRAPKISKAAGPAAAAALEMFTRELARRSLARAAERARDEGRSDEGLVVTTEDVEVVTAGLLLDFR